MNELRQKQIVVYSISFGTNILYLILMGILATYDASITKDPQNALIILGVGVVISVIASYSYVRMNDINKVELRDIIIRLAIYHIPALLGLAGSMYYLYV